MSRDVSKNRNVGFYINGSMDRLDNAYYELVTLVKFVKPINIHIQSSFLV